MESKGGVGVGEENGGGGRTLQNQQMKLLSDSLLLSPIRFNISLLHMPALPWLVVVGGGWGGRVSRVVME